MTVLQLYELAKGRFAQVGIDSPAFESDCLCEDILGIDRTKRMLSPETEISEGDGDRFSRGVDKRCEGYPLQYILGRWEFCGLPFKVGEGVLIPRDDTETLVNVAYQRLKHRKENCRVIDLCAGTGCVGITLKKYLPKAELFAVELSGEAFPYLMENCRINQVDIKIIRGDVTDYKIVENFCDPNSLGDYLKVDCILSNPPYITDKDMESLQKEVTFEPEMALRGGGDGLKFYKIITMLWKDILADNGILAFECGYNQSENVAEIMRENGFDDIDIVSDLGGIGRVVVGNLRR